MAQLSSAIGGRAGENAGQKSYAHGPASRNSTERVNRLRTPAIDRGSSRGSRRVARPCPVARTRLPGETPTGVADSAVRALHAGPARGRARRPAADEGRAVDYDLMASQARAALIVAAMRRSLLTYGELGRAVGIDRKIPLPGHVSRILDKLSTVCIAAGEPSLAVLVVGKSGGAPGRGFTKGQGRVVHRGAALLRVWSGK